MVIMTNKAFREKIEEEKQKVVERMWQDRKISELRDRVFLLEAEIKKLKGEEVPEDGDSIPTCNPVAPGCSVLY